MKEWLQNLKVFLGLWILLFAIPLYAADYPLLSKEVHWHSRVSDTWTKTDTAIYVWGAVATIFDWRQTQQIATEPWNYRESNPLLGPHPDNGQVNRYFAFNMLLLQPAILYFLPADYRRYFLGGNASLETFVVFKNKDNGLNPFR